MSASAEAGGGFFLRVFMKKAFDERLVESL